jgi:hypothetical protein
VRQIAASGLNLSKLRVGCLPNTTAGRYGSQRYPLMRKRKSVTGADHAIWEACVVVTGGSPFFLSSKDGEHWCLSSTSEVSKYAYVDGGTSYAMSLEEGETIYYLTTRGWECGDEPPDCVESWRRTVSDGRISWRCAWVNLRISADDRDALRKKYQVLPQ